MSKTKRRHCGLLSHDLSWIEQPERWPGLAGIARLERYRETKATGERSREVAYYILSDKEQTAAGTNDLARSHWAIENSVRWVLDVTSREDECRVRKRNAAENLGLIRRTALGKKKRVSIKRRRCHIAI